MFFDGPACALELEFVCDEEDIKERCFGLDFEDFVERADIMDEVSAMIRQEDGGRRRRVNQRGKRRSSDSFNRR